jgi:hypothetical protein
LFNHFVTENFFILENALLVARQENEELGNLIERMNSKVNACGRFYFLHECCICNENANYFDAYLSGKIEYISTMHSALVCALAAGVKYTQRKPHAVSASEQTACADDLRVQLCACSGWCWRGQSLHY